MKHVGQTTDSKDIVSQNQLWNAIPRPPSTDSVTLFADTAANAGWVNALMGGPYTSRQADHPDGSTPQGTNGAVNYYWVLNATFSGNVFQLAVPYLSNSGTGLERMKWRNKGGTSWTAWRDEMANPMTAAGDLLVGGTAGVPARLPIGVANRTLRVNAAGTALEWVDPGVYAAWASTQQTYTNGGQLTLNHNLGYIPRDVSLELVFTTATNNWAAGMTMQISVGPDSSSSSRGAAVRKTSTQLIIRIAAGGLTGIDYSTGAAFDIPPANVALVARVLG